MIKQLVDSIRLAVADPNQLPQVANIAQSLQGWNDSDVDSLLIELTDLESELEQLLSKAPPTAILSSDLETDPTAALNATPQSGHLDSALQPVIHNLAIRETKLAKEGSESFWSPTRTHAVEALYHKSPVSSDLRNHLLRWLATAEDDEPRELWVDLICNAPPEHRLGIVLAFSPLMQASFTPTDELLSKLLNEATRHSQIAPAVFDLFNYYFRIGRVENHPVTQRAPQLSKLLGQLATQLGRIEEGDIPPGSDARQVNQLVSDSVALIVSLCDSFALIEYEEAIPQLHQTMQLRHRRVQTEAAAALARLDDDSGKQMLIQLAEQPVSRLRVLAYAEELGFVNEISLELQGEISMAESHLAIWLSEPDQMGLAPSDIQLINNREMYWPSYEHPIQCYLFKYSYGKGDRAHSNIGICGPLTHAFAADLQHLSTDEMYAAFAGWQTIHNEIFQMSVARAQQAFPNQLRRLKEALATDELDDIKIQSIGSFFGEIVLIATAKIEDKPGTVVVDSHDSNWFEAGNPEAPIDFQLAYSIWRGKQLLSKFNTSDSL